METNTETNVEIHTPIKSKKTSNPTDQMVALSDIELGENVRSDLPDIDDLVSSIKSVGIILPLVLAPLENGKFRLIAGYRRYHAAKKLKMKEVPAVFRDSDTDERLVLSLVENIQRSDMNALDIANAIKTMVETVGNQEKVSKLLGKSEGYVSQHLALLTLPKKAQVMVKSEKIDMARARQLTRLKDDDLIINMLEKAQTSTAPELQASVDFALQKVKAKEKTAKEKEKTKAKTKAKASSAVENDSNESDNNASTDESPYASSEIKPLSKKPLIEKLDFFLAKENNAESEQKKLEYKFKRQGLEIAAGLREH